MKTFKIKKKTTILEINIHGKVLDERTDCYVYRPILFGIIKLYIRIFPRNLYSERIRVNYVMFSAATSFTENEAEMFLRLTEEEPDKLFIRIG